MLYDPFQSQSPFGHSFGMRNKAVFDREAFDIGGSHLGGRFRGGINPGGMYTGGNTPAQPWMGMGGPGQQFPMQTGGNGQAFPSPLMALWGRRMSGY